MEKKKDRLLDPVSDLKGVGPKIAVFLEQKGISTMGDLFWFLPIRYVNRAAEKTINEVAEGERATVVGRVVESKSLFFRHSRKKAYEAVVDDGTGSISIKWFQWVRAYLKKICRKGNLLVVSGEITRFRDRLQMVHPEIFVIEDEREIENCNAVTTIYSEIEGLKQGSLRNLIKQAFEDYGTYIASTVPDGLEKSLGLVPIYEAFSNLHFPGEESMEEQMSEVGGQKSGISDYRLPPEKYFHRLVFEEYFLFQMALMLKREGLRKEKGLSFTIKGRHYTKFISELPFELTGAQARAMNEIGLDMLKDTPMNRLLQGDVGSGKTVCAVAASCAAIDSGYQVAFMAPTEILAEQHYLTIHRFFEGMGIPIAFLRGGMGSERKAIIDDVRNGRASVVVGTHALIQKDVIFHKLGLVIIDEQHRFGVMQRKMLRQKSGLTAIPHILVMTATPIPRTLSMIVYGDLDVSVIDELPKGRQKIWTKVFPDKDKAGAYKIIENELKEGRQAYIVFPLVEESEKIELLNAKKMTIHLQKTVFPSYRVGLLHGRMRPEEKEEVMGRFKDGKIDILACTTVIEVGIDVPNATVIMVENAERFGLSQLHQLRGRVGRGIFPSKCILMTSGKRTAMAAKRLKVMEETTDGFVIAEEDMKLRGPGDMLGVRQAGLPDFRVGDIVRDVNVMIEARKAAENVLDGLKPDELKRIRYAMMERWKDNMNLSDVA